MPAAVLPIPQRAIPLRPWKLSHSTRPQGEKLASAEGGGKYVSLACLEDAQGVTGIFLAGTSLVTHLPTPMLRTPGQTGWVLLYGMGLGAGSAPTGGYVSHKDWSYYYEIINRSDLGLQCHTLSSPPPFQASPNSLLLPGANHWAISEVQPTLNASGPQANHSCDGWLRGQLNGNTGLSGVSISVS